jgi:hypothetical protein
MWLALSMLVVASALTVAAVIRNRGVHAASSPSAGLSSESRSGSPP